MISRITLIKQLFFKYSLIIFTFKVNLLNFERDNFLINPFRAPLHHSLVLNVSLSLCPGLSSLLARVNTRGCVSTHSDLEKCQTGAFEDKRSQLLADELSFHQIFIRGLCPLNGVLWCRGCTAHPSQHFQAAQAVDEVIIFLKECGRLFSVRVNNWLRQGGAFHISSPHRQSLPLSPSLCWMCVPLVHSPAERPALLSKLIVCLPSIAVRLHLDPGCFQRF